MGVAASTTFTLNYRAQGETAQQQKVTSTHLDDVVCGGILFVPEVLHHHPQWVCRCLHSIAVLKALLTDAAWNGSKACTAREMHPTLWPTIRQRRPSC